MKMKAPTNITMVVFMVAAMMVLITIPGTAAVNCNYMELVPCADAISSSQAPSAACCSKVKEQRPCFCGYLRDPNLRQFVSPATAQRVASQCGVSIPQC
ncbi:hypothetical protein L6452_10438 [Arctium lappa]|uniref:Uncharacterized protein n=1 Tax=Arctium lappa TaxID=4217 RepID=A0ACB9DMS4_ARCLA|nr:hypothetical protein L6452_10438 [Arctium lappa]